ncbi:unnamed protein product [Hymenolepis diminuta]|uniref:ANF_receptor domain-containing protein n=1 Tax=Hymenolepis diminuta TaxID=6216 RepID=A0A158QFT1_HYMDI|nr:unnamed protein product [Hymenolepis diminuta]
MEICKAMDSSVIGVTVLSVVNCPVRYDSFRRGVVAVPNDRTGIITSPSCEEAIRLAQYAKYSGWSPITGAPDTSDTMGQHFSQPLPLTFGRVPPEIEHVSLSGIHTVRTIADILKGKENITYASDFVPNFSSNFYRSSGILAEVLEERAWTMKGGVVFNSGFGIVFAMLTKLPVDSENVIRHVRLSCSNCQRRMHACLKDGDGSTSEPSSLFICLTPDCPLSGQRFDPLDLEHVILTQSFRHRPLNVGLWLNFQYSWSVALVLASLSPAVAICTTTGYKWHTSFRVIFECQLPVMVGARNGRMYEMRLVAGFSLAAYTFPLGAIIDQQPYTW